MKELKDYIHLLIGCPIQCLCDMPDGRYILTGVITKEASGHDINRVQLFNETRKQIYWLDIDVIIPVLRPLDSMTEAEMRDLIMENNFYLDHRVTDIQMVWSQVHFNVRYNSKGRSYHKSIHLDALHPDQFKWALNKSFDLFDLHPAGLCVYENEVKG